MIIKFIYTLFLALLVALFVGFGVDAFYTGPENPKYPIELEIQKAGCDEPTDTTTVRKEFNQKQEEYSENFKLYNRNVSIISLIFAIIILVTSFTLLSKIKMIADGILLGGVFTTAYSIIRGLMSANSKFRFLIIVVGLIIALTLGYIKFIRNREK